MTHIEGGIPPEDIESIVRGTHGAVKAKEKSTTTGNYECIT